MKARIDGHVKYKAIRKGRTIQTDLAKQLHVEACVDEGPCGIPELQKFQDYLCDYQINVLTVDKPHCVIFEGSPSDKKILLVKVDNHYHGCTSYGGFLDKSYFCHDCNKAYDHEDRNQHPCKGIWCWSCHRRDCEDFKTVKQAHLPGKIPNPCLWCKECNRCFFGKNV